MHWQTSNAFKASMRFAVVYKRNPTNHAMSVTPVLNHFESESAAFLTPNLSVTQLRIA